MGSFGVPDSSLSFLSAAHSYRNLHRFTLVKLLETELLSVSHVRFCLHTWIFAEIFMQDLQESNLLSYTTSRHLFKEGKKKSSEKEKEGKDGVERHIQGIVSACSFI